MKWSFADVSVIARARQKDQMCIQYLDSKLRNVILGWLGVNVLHHISTDKIATSLYYLLTTGWGSKTFGEEYCCILPVDVYERTRPSVLKRLVLVLSPLFQTPTWLEPLAPLHLVLFYWYGRYAEFVRRLLGLRYIYHPRQAPRPVVDWLYRGISIVLLAITTIRLCQRYNNRLEEENIDEDIPEVAQCRLCLGKRRNTAITPCGHLFCWNCLYQWLHVSANHHNMCPLCRQPCKIAEVYCIKDPYLK